MKYLKKMSEGFLIACVVTIIMTSIVCAAEVPRGYNTPIPSSIMTPDKVKTRIGTLEFFDGVPTAKTAELVLDNLMFLRGVEAFLNGLPMCPSMHWLRVIKVSELRKPIT